LAQIKKKKKINFVKPKIQKKPPVKLVSFKGKVSRKTLLSKIALIPAKLINAKKTKKSKYLKLKLLRSVKLKIVTNMLKKLQTRFQIKNLFLKNNFKKNLKRVFKY